MKRLSGDQKGKVAFLGTGDAMSGVFAEGTQPKCWCAFFVRDGKRDHTTVGRNRHRADVFGAEIQVHSVRGIDRRVQHRLRFPCKPECRCREADRGQRRGDRQRPAHSFPRPPAMRNRRRNTGLRPALRNPIELEADVVHRLPAIVGVFGKTRSDHPFQSGRSQRLDRGDRLRLARNDRGDDARPILSSEGRRTGEHLVQDRSEREDIASCVDGFPRNLLRRHVLIGADDGAFLGERLLLRQFVEGGAARR